MQAHPILAAAVCLSILNLTLPSHAARIKCWTNSEGVRECGNTVPPEYAQQGHTEKSATGLTTGSTARAKTKEELTKEATERERAEAERIERERVEAIQAEQDRVLLRTYSTEEDLLYARDGQLTAIDSRIRHTEQVTADLEASLAKLKSKAAKQERGGKKVDQNLREQIDATQSRIDDNRAFIAARNQERVEINQTFAVDLKRWRTLKGR